MYEFHFIYTGNPGQLTAQGCQLRKHFILRAWTEDGRSSRNISHTHPRYMALKNQTLFLNGTGDQINFEWKPLIPAAGATFFSGILASSPPKIAVVYCKTSLDGCFPLLGFLWMTRLDDGMVVPSMKLFKISKLTSKAWQFMFFVDTMYGVFTVPTLDPILKWRKHVRHMTYIVDVLRFVPEFLMISFLSLALHWLPNWKQLPKTRWWFQIFSIFTPTLGNDPIWLIFFRWVETTN